MISLYDENSMQLIGSVDETQLEFLVDELEEEGLEDQDYAITPLLLEVWEKEGRHPELVAMLRSALGDREEMNILWEEE